MLKLIAMIAAAALTAIAAVQIAQAQAPADGAASSGARERGDRQGGGVGGATSPFTIISQGTGVNVWVLDSRQGRLTVCTPPSAANEGPICAAWTQIQ